MNCITNKSKGMLHAGEEDRLINNLAQIKTERDYALVLEHCNGYSKPEAEKYAKESHGEDLFEALFERNKALLKAIAHEKVSINIL